MLEASNLKTMESWYQNLSPYVNDKEFPLRGGKKDLPPVLIGLIYPCLEYTVSASILRSGFWMGFNSNLGAFFYSVLICTEIFRMLS